MRRRRKKYDLYIVIVLAILTVGYFFYNHVSSETRGINAYSTALESYKNSDFEKAYYEFAKVPSASSLKESALFRQARCATNMGKKELAIKKYNKIVHSSSKSSIVPISEYNMANLMMEINDLSPAERHFKHIIKLYPTSDYAVASEYFLGLIEISDLPESENKKQKVIEKAGIHFKNYIEKKINPDLKLFDKIREQKLLGEIWESQINEYKVYDKKIAEWVEKEKEWRKDYSSLAEIQELYKKHNKLYEDEKALSEEYKRERKAEMERIKKYEADSKASIERREADIKFNEKRLDDREIEIENERKNAIHTYNENVNLLKRFKGLIESEIQKKVNKMMQSQRHSEENLGFADRIRAMFNSKKIEREREVKEKIIEIEDYVRSR